MNVQRKTLAIALVSLGLLPMMMPDASDHCAQRVVRRHHAALRTIATTRVIERTIIQPEIIQEPMPVATTVTAAPVCTTMEAVPVVRVRRHHHLLGVSTPLFGFHVL